MPLRKQAPDVQVYVAGKLRTDVHCMEVSFGAGARGLGTATLMVQPELRKKGRRRMLNLELSAFGQPEVEVRIGGRVVHWGKVLAQQGQIGGDGDPIMLVSRMDEHHFGAPLHYARFGDPKTGKFAWHPLPTIFNPQFDGVTKSNQGLREKGVARFVHQQSVETQPAQRYQKVAFIREAWTLPEAVHYLCNVCNLNQTLVKNPTLRELKKALELQNQIWNYEAPIGAFLPEQLDRILEPFGYSWCVDFPKPGERKIRVFRRGDGKPSQLKLQPPGAVVDLAKSNLDSCNLTADVGNRTFNAVLIFGGYEEYEVTVELLKAWKGDQDDTPLEDLSKNAEGWLASQPLARVWRDWVLNEAGDYIGLRNAYRKPHDFDAVFGKGYYLERRRHFLPCLTLLPDGSPQGHAGGVFIEWWDNEAEEWKPLDELSPEGRQVRILERECGIRFDGPEIPYEIYAQGNYAKVRVTARVRSDRRIEYRTPPRASRLADIRYEVIDAESKFPFRKRHKSSRFAGVVNTTDEVDTKVSMSDYASQLVNAWNAATIDGTATLAGVNFDVSRAIGTTIGGIDGRGVNFAVGSGGIPRFPTLVGVRLDIPGQQTVFTLDTFRGETR